MEISEFALERYFAKYEFSARYLLSSSDCDGLKMERLLHMADDEVRKLWSSLTLGYTESQGLPVLREDIASLYESISSDDVLVAAPEEGVFLAMNTLLEPGDHVICTFPGYQSLYEIAKGIGCSVTQWEPDESNDWRFDVNFLRKQITPKTKLIVINFPHNPTGYLPSLAEFHEIIGLAKERDIYLFSDEMYRYLEYDANDRLPAAADVYDNAISLFGMSKTFGLAGLRIGWIVSKNKNLVGKLARFKDYTTICSSAPSEVLALAGLRAKKTIISENLSTITSNLKLLRRFIQERPQVFSCNLPKAGTVCFPKIQIPMPASEFSEALVEEAAVMVLPSTVYAYDDKHVRIGLGRADMPQALQVFGDWLSKRRY